MNKAVTVVDVAVELAFGAVIGCAFFFLVAGGRGVAVPYPILAFALTCLFAQAAVDLARGRGWKYSWVCAAACSLGVAGGGYAAFGGTVLRWWGASIGGA